MNEKKTITDFFFSFIITLFYVIFVIFIFNCLLITNNYIIKTKFSSPLKSKMKKAQNVIFVPVFYNKNQQFLYN